MTESASGVFRRPIVLPVKKRIDHHRLRHAGSTVAAVDMQIGIVSAHAVGKDRLLPIDMAADRLGIGIDQQLCRVESQAALGSHGP